MHTNIPSISESFNAKTTSTEELCNTFITNDFFDQLACPNNSIMIGPRGSGKTTLMRMLEVESLEIWNRENSDKYRDIIDFSGVFIPTDRYWKKQYEKIQEVINSSNITQVERERMDKALYLLDVLFIYHVIEQFLSVVNYRCSRIVNKKNKFRSVDISKEDEMELVLELSSLYGCTPKINSIRSLFSSIVIKKQDISKSANRLIKGSDETCDLDEISLIEILNSSVSIVNNYLNESHGKWAFLFDELELAPDLIIQPLVDEMRGGHKDIIYKLALSPYHQDISITHNTDSSMKEQDLNYINLTGLNDKEGSKFAKQLCTSLFVRKGLFENIENYFESPKPTNIDKDFKELISKDEYFRLYLEDRNLIRDEYRANDSLLRKVKFIAHLRNYKRDENNQIKRRRRPADYYAGFDHICKAVEYNPRMLIGLMNKFIPIAKEGKVSLAAQLNSLDEYFQSFKALLSTIALDSNNSKFNNIYDFIDEIANYFNNEIYGVEFKSEPKGSFIINDKINEGLLEIVGYALNAGALISVDTDIGTFNKKKEGLRNVCRLSYMFSHSYGLLMTRQKEMDLDELIYSTALNKANVNIVKLFKNTNPKQYNLELK
ncbi:MAG: ATP-binding protein [Gammaproteobacteria bacterium]|nr:ATP-binding protein [Gammaproteobacteria bacterium]